MLTEEAYSTWHVITHAINTPVFDTQTLFSSFSSLIRSFWIILVIFLAGLLWVKKTKSISTLNNM